MEELPVAFPEPWQSLFSLDETIAIMRYHYKWYRCRPPSVSSRNSTREGKLPPISKRSSANGRKTGWEFYRVDSIGVQIQAGCLAALFGQGPQQRTYYVYYFPRARRERSAKRLTMRWSERRTGVRFTFDMTSTL
jgi:hypothetical protein